MEAIKLLGHKGCFHGIYDVHLIWQICQTLQTKVFTLMQSEPVTEVLSSTSKISKAYLNRVSLCSRGAWCRTVDFACILLIQGRPLGRGITVAGPTTVELLQSPACTSRQWWAPMLADLLSKMLWRDSHINPLVNNATSLAQPPS